MTLSADAFAYVADLVRRRSAILLQPGKEYLVESRLLPLARTAGVSVEELVARLRARPVEADVTAVVEALTTNETSWFRDSTPFSALAKHVLPRLVAARGGVGRLRMWSAACSTGQEPYSIAMTLLDQLPATMDAEILATDLSAQVIERARAGRYTQLEVNRGLPAPMLVRHLTRAGAEWQVSDAVRAMVSFTVHNLLDAPPAGPFDVVFLRNVLIYFDLETKRDILRRVAQVLRPDGVLVLGAAETTLGVDDGWDRVSVERGSVYQRATRRAADPAGPGPAAGGLPQPWLPPAITTAGATRGEAR